MARANPREVYRILFAAASRTVQRLAKDPRHLGAQGAPPPAERLPAHGEALAINEIVLCTVTPVSTKPMAYDLNGNLVRVGAMIGPNRTYTYDSQDRLVGVTDNTDPAKPVSMVMSYGPGGQLLKTVDMAAPGMPERHRLLWGGQIYAEYSMTGVLLQKYILGPSVDAKIAQLPGGDFNNVQFTLPDAHGSVHQTVEKNGAIEETKFYTAWGVSLNLTATNLAMGAIASRFGYNGRPGLGNSGLLDFRARFYDPDLGRFLNPDPSGTQDGMNRYAFVHGDPLNNSDPSGLSAVGELRKRFRIWSSQFRDRYGRYSRALADPKLRRAIAFRLSCNNTPSEWQVMNAWQNEKFLLPTQLGALARTGVYTRREVPGQLSFLRGQARNRAFVAGVRYGPGMAETVLGFLPVLGTLRSFDHVDSAEDDLVAARRSGDMTWLRAAQGQVELAKFGSVASGVFDMVGAFSPRVAFSFSPRLRPNRLVWNRPGRSWNGEAIVDLSGGRYGAAVDTIESVLTHELSAYRFKADSIEFDPKLSVPGQTRLENGRVVVKLGREALRSREEIGVTLLHEERHVRLIIKESTVEHGGNIPFHRDFELGAQRQWRRIVGERDRWNGVGNRPLWWQERKPPR